MMGQFLLALFIFGTSCVLQTAQHKESSLITESKLPLSKAELYQQLVTLQSQAELENLYNQYTQLALQSVGQSKTTRAVLSRKNLYMQLAADIKSFEQEYKRLNDALVSGDRNSVLQALALVPLELFDAYIDQFEIILQQVTQSIPQAASASSRQFQRAVLTKNFMKAIATDVTLLKQLRESMSFPNEIIALVAQFVPIVI